MDAACLGTPVSTMNPAGKAIKLVDRYRQRFGWLAFPVAVWKKFGDDQAGNLAALVAYYAFASIFPLLLVLVTVLNIVLHDHPALTTDLENGAVKNYCGFGTYLTSSLKSFNETGPALVIGIILTFFGARGVANAMQNALSSVWEIPKGRGHALRRRGQRRVGPQALAAQPRGTPAYRRGCPCVPAIR
jgi:membrane protein